MSYDPNTMPTTLQEWNALVDYYADKSASEHAAAVAAATAQAEAAWAELPDTDEKPTLADYIAQAVSNVPPAEPREYFEKMYACYYPQPVEEAPAPTFAELKAQKKAELDAAFYTVSRKPFVVTAEGWRADANEESAFRVRGLIDGLEMTGAETAQFMDYDNIERPVSLSGLKQLYLLIIQNGQRLFDRKWQLREAIEQAQTEGELGGIQIAF